MDTTTATIRINTALHRGLHTAASLRGQRIGDLTEEILQAWLDKPENRRIRELLAAEKVGVR